MANFKDSPHFSTHDDYYTPHWAWKQIERFITKDNRIYEAFSLNSNLQSAKHLEDLGFDVKADDNRNYLTDPLDPSEYDLVVSNPPFQRIRSFKSRKESLKWKCINKLFEVGKPFIILLNATNLSSRWFRELLEEHEAIDKVNIIFSSRKINYDKYEKGGKVKIPMKNKCSFNSVYVCYKVLKSNQWV